MIKQSGQRKKQKIKDNALPPDKETLHATDPQDNMEGPISSLMQSIKVNAEENNKESKIQADRKKEKTT